MANPNLNPAWVMGLDVSHYQGTVDWNSVAQGGFKFAFIKATEGTSWEDPELSANWAGAEAAGLLRGAYHFYDPGSDPTQQAEHFLNTVWPGGGQPLLAPGDLPPVLDIETLGTQNAAEVIQGIQTWLSVVSQGTSRVPIVYTDPSFWNGLGTQEFSNYTLWVADYGVAAPTLPEGWQQWKLWQFSETGSITGVTGPVDLDVFQGSLQELELMAYSTSTP